MCASVVLAAFAQIAWAQPRALYQQTQYKGQEIQQELRDAVAKAVTAGQTLEHAQATVLMDAFKDWEFYAQQRPLNVAGMYRALTANRR